MNTRSRSNNGIVPPILATQIHRPKIQCGHFDSEGGCNAVLQNLIMTLADPGEAILVPTPYYAVFEFDVAARTGCCIVPVNNFHNSDKSDGPLGVEARYPNVAALEYAQ